MSTNKPITAVGYDGKRWLLIDSYTQKSVKKGDTRTSFRGTQSIVEGGYAPHKPGSTGRISTSNGEYYPTVYGAQWIRI